MNNSSGNHGCNPEMEDGGPSGVTSVFDTGGAPNSGVAADAANEQKRPLRGTIRDAMSRTSASDANRGNKPA